MNYQDSVVRLPPSSHESERAVLGACLLDPNVLDDVRQILAAGDWYAGDHRATWTALCELADAGSPIDLLTLRNRLDADDRGLDMPFLSGLVEDCPGTKNAQEYARIIRECAERREIIAAAGRASEIAFNERGGAQRALAEFSAVGCERQQGHVVELKTAAREWLDVVDGRMHGTDVGLRVGYRDLDRRWGGLRGGDLVIIAGRPKMGKTTLAMAIAENVAEHENVLVFSLEMSRVQLMDRMGSRFSGIPLSALRSGELTEEHTPKLAIAMSRIAGMNLALDDTGGLHIADLRSRARARHRKTPIKLVVIDYLQLLRSDGENQNLRVAEITAQCKALAKELDCPVILLSQLNRGVEQRQNKRPMPSDLRDSGAIEQDADYVVFAYRHEIYENNSPRKGVMEVITSLARMEEPGTDYLLADLAHSTLSTPPDHWMLPDESVAQPKSFSRKGRDL